MIEFILGASVAAFCIYLANAFIQRAIEQANFSRLRVNNRQSQVVNYLSRAGILNYYMGSSPFDSTPLKTQATEFHDKRSLRVLIVEDRAYWIERNTLFEAEIIDGNMDPSTTKAIDTMALDKVQLDKIIFVVDRLTERFNDEDGGTG
jgi:hypothetical protein